MQKTRFVELSPPFGKTHGNLESVIFERASKLSPSEIIRNVVEHDTMNKIKGKPTMGKNNFFILRSL